MSLPTARLIAQDDASKVIQKIVNAYHSDKPMRFSGSMKMYPKTNAAKVSERMESEFILHGKKFYCSIGPLQMLLNDDYYVSVDKADKLIMIGHHKDVSGTANVPVLNMDAFALLIKEKKIEAIISKQGGNSLLQLNDAENVTGYSAYSIEYDASTGYMKKVLLERKDANTASGKTMVLEINYTIPVAISANKNVFSEKPFFSIVNKRIQLTDNYRGYQVINQL
ncbi:MAG: hypothetical protein QM726_17735 [Chitinophagaceae bacterium]